MRLAAYFFIGAVVGVAVWYLLHLAQDCAMRGGKLVRTVSSYECVRVLK